MIEYIESIINPKIIYIISEVYFCNKYLTSFVNENIPIMGFTRGIKVNGKYKTYYADFHKSKDKIEKSIQRKLDKNEKMVILRLAINEN